MAEATVANGYPLGRPGDRDPHPLDDVIRKAIEKMPMETRLYPDVYAWSVTNAVLDALGAEEYRCDFDCDKCRED